jgi:hypothetical protein
MTTTSKCFPSIVAGSVRDSMKNSMKGQIWPIQSNNHTAYFAFPVNMARENEAKMGQAQVYRLGSMSDYA